MKKIYENSSDREVALHLLDKAVQTIKQLRRLIIKLTNEEKKV